MRFSYIALALLAALSMMAPQVFAAPVCTPTVTVKAKNYPGKENIHPGNDLTLPAGKAYPVEGNRVIITGRIRDPECKPVPGAIIELWQNNPYGKWILADGDALASTAATFTGTGQTYTNEAGEFSFITLFPAPIKDSAPSVYIRIEADGNAPYSTRLFFSGDQRNDADPVYKKLSAKALSDSTLLMRSDYDDTLVGTIEIVLPKKAPYRTY